ncbi:hypothetical protein [Treponema sp. R80B11-R83G3]
MIERKEELLLQGHQIELAKLTLAFNQLAETVTAKSKYDDIPEWLTLEAAVKLKGGGALASYKNDLILQPCCGTNSKLIGGRKCWHKNNVIDWLNISDSDLKAYAEKWKVKLPEKYLRRSA